MWSLGQCNREIQKSTVMEIKTEQKHLQNSDLIILTHLDCCPLPLFQWLSEISSFSFHEFPPDFLIFCFPLSDTAKIKFQKLRNIIVIKHEYI